MQLQQQDHQHFRIQADTNITISMVVDQFVGKKIKENIIL
jgi:hypothetical protein